MQNYVVMRGGKHEANRQTTGILLFMTPFPHANHVALVANECTMSIFSFIKLLVLNAHKLDTLKGFIFPTTLVRH